MIIESTSTSSSSPILCNRQCEKMNNGMRTDPDRYLVYYNVFGIRVEVNANVREKEIKSRAN